MENEMKVEALPQEEQMFAELAPQGEFSAKALNNLVKATNRLLPVFKQEGNYPAFSDGISGALPEDFVRVLVMFQGASEAAAKNDSVDPQMVFSLDDINDDTSLIAVAGKINALAGSKDFKLFLKAPPPAEEEEVEQVEEMEEPQMSDEEMNNLFMERM